MAGESGLLRVQVPDFEGFELVAYGVDSDEKTFCQTMRLESAFERPSSSGVQGLRQ